MKFSTAKKIMGLGMVLNAVLLAGFFMPSNRVDARMSVHASISAGNVKVGNRIRIKAATAEVTYSSSDSTIASVDSQGVVTGKKAGKVSISVKRKGYAAKIFPVQVVKNGRKPSVLPVTFSEITIKENGGVVSVFNQAKKGTVKKVVYHYTVQVEQKAPEVESGSVVEAVNAEVKRVTKELTLLSGTIAAGKSTVAVRKGDADVMDTSISQARLTKIELYTGDARCVFDAVKQSYTFEWGTKDTKAPVFEGFLKKKSVTGNGDVYRIYYSDKKNSYNFKQFVTATDNRDGRVTVKADTSKINWKKEGVYRIYYRATDLAGNTATSWAKVRVLIPGSSEYAADRVLRSITRPGWSDTKKAKAIHRYVSGHCSYVHSSAHVQWRTAALRGMRYQSGDCYTYYSICRLLLTRAGIPNVMIKRYPTYIGRHFWNLVYVQGGWYHFDTTPRSRRRNLCLRTDAQMWGAYRGATFQFNKSLYPKRATRRL